MKRRFIAIAMLLSVLISNTETISAENDYITKYGGYINEICNEYGICPELIESMIYFESDGDPNCKSSAGAIGLMQIIPKHHKERMQRLGVTDLYDPYQNILVGVDFIGELSQKYEPYEALTAYNCGEYSKTLKKVQNGGTWKYADNILAYSEDLERAHGK